MIRTVTFKQADVSRAFKGASAAGMDIGTMEIDPVTGRIVLIAKSEPHSMPAEDKPDTDSPFQKWKEKNAGKA
jgi:hypothetical protein